MLQKITPALKGLIAGIVMIGLMLFLFYKKVDGSSFLIYLPYTVYACGIVWTLIAYRKSANYKGKFGDLFGHGFRCFVVTTLIMVMFTFFFIKAHPEFAEENAKKVKEYLYEQKSKTPAEIETIVANEKKHFATTYVSRSIFGYLIIGAIVTAGCSAVLLIRRN